MKHCAARDSARFPCKQAKNCPNNDHRNRLISARFGGDWANHWANGSVSRGPNRKGRYGSHAPTRLPDHKATGQLPATVIVFAALVLVLDGVALAVDSRAVLERPLWTA